MSIFDIFTGKSAKDAAAQNAALYQGYKTEGMGYLNDAVAPTTAALDSATAAWSPVAALGQKYGAATDLYSDALGVNGTAGNTRATDAFHASPGYDWTRDQAIEGVARNANRFGAGGNEIAAVTDRASNLADTEYGNWLTRLGGFVNPELQATTSAAGGVAAGEGAKAGFYQTDANNRVNLAGNVTGGIANSNTASAQAQMNASTAFWNGLMSLGGNVARAFTGSPTSPRATA